jgi:hypothetical protein
MSLLTLIQKAAVRVGIPKPSVVVAATDLGVQQLLEFAQEEGEQLARYGDWRVLRKEKTFTTVAAETQTDTPIPTDLGAFIDRTFWNRSRRERIYGPVSPEVWQRWKATTTFPITDTFCLRGTSWLMAPTPIAGQTIAYEYRSKNWCQSSGGTGQAAWAADTDTGILDERLMGMGLVWRYKQAKTLDWEADYSKYEFEVAQALAADQPRKTLNMGGETMAYGVTTPDGSWNL